MDQEKIGVIGLWHLGCVLCAAWSSQGKKVIGFDYSKTLVSQLNNNQLPIFEPDLEIVFQRSRLKNNLVFKHEIQSLKDCDYIFLAFDTPVLENDESDLSLLEEAIYDLRDVLKNNAIVIISSQTPVGICNKFRNILREKSPSAELVYSPENLRLGNAIECYLNPGRIIIGAESEKAIIEASKLFKNIPAPIIKMSLSSSEMVKHAINSFLANSIVFTNHLADLCEQSNANIIDVVEGLKTDDRIGDKAYLSPGIGFSGGTLGRDLRILADLNKSSGTRATLFESILDLNKERKNTILKKIADLIQGDFSGKTIAILGITYKPGTSTLRRSLPLEIINLLSKKGANIRVFDPKANYDELNTTFTFKICNSIEEAILNAHLIVLLTEWDDFKKYNWESGIKLISNPIFFDTKNFLYNLELQKIGYDYYGVGLKPYKEAI